MTQFLVTLTSWQNFVNLSEELKLHFSASLVYLDNAKWIFCSVLLKTNKRLDCKQFNNLFLFLILQDNAMYRVYIALN